MSKIKNPAGACALALALALSSCTAGPDPSIVPAGVSHHANEISDQVHGGGTPGFFFLPPMVAAPTYGGTFSGGLSPVVQIDQRSAGSEWSPIAIFTRFTGPDGVTVVEDQDQYQVNWHTDRFHLDPSLTYRIRVLVGGLELGFADVDVVAAGAQLRNVNTAEYIPLLDGRTLPIKFRVEPAALVCVGVTCAANDACHEAGACDRFTGGCTNPAKADGSACPSGGECSLAGACRAGACVSPPAPDGTPCTNGVCGLGACRAGPDLSVRFDGPASSPAGAQFVLSLTVANDGPEPAPSVTTRLVLPTGLRWFDLDPYGSGRLISASPFVYEFDHGTIAVGESRVVSIRATQLTVSDATFVATVATSAVDRDPSNDQASATVRVIPANADLRAEIRDFSETQPHLVGSQIRHRILLFNDGPDAIPGFSVVDEVPTGMELLAAAPVGTNLNCNYDDPDHPYCFAGTTSCRWTQGLRQVECSGDVILPGAVEAVDVLMRPIASGSYVNSAQVAALGTADPSAANDTATLGIAVLPTAYLAVEVSAPGSSLVGDAYDFVATITNAGPDVASGVVAVIGPLPSNVQLLSTSIACTGTGTLSCALGDLPPGAARSLTVALRGLAVGNASTTMQVASNEVDPLAGNNTITRTTSVSAIPLPTGCDVSTTIEGPTTGKAGVPFTLRFEVANAGPDAATATKVVIQWPTEFAFGAMDSPGATCTWVWGGASYFLECDYGTLDGNSSQVLTLDGYTNAVGDAPFSVKATTLTPDRDTTNDAASSVVAVAPALTDVRVEIQMISQEPYAVGQFIQYKLLVFNDGPDTLPGYSFVQSLPAGLAIEYASPMTNPSMCFYNDPQHPYCMGRGVFGGQMTCRWTPGEGSASCDGGAIPPAGVEGFTIGVRPATAGAYTDTFRVDPVGIADPNAANDVASITFTVVP